MYDLLRALFLFLKFMQRKSIILLLTTISCSSLFPSVYVGLKGDAAVGKAKPIIKSTLLEKMKNLPDTRLGVLFGVMMPSPLIAPFLEGDVMLNRSKIERESVINGIKEFLSVKKGFEFGVMPGVQVSWVPLVSWFGALRISFSKIEANPVNMPVVTGIQAPFMINGTSLSNATKSTYLVGIEPTLGLNFHLASMLTARLAASYIYVPSKTIYNNYVGYGQVLNGASAENITLKQSGFRIAAALIYNF
jgi:hypothetical protein